MIGIWAVTVWQALGSPPALRLVELGPGRGTLMADALRGTAPLRAFADALSVHFVEVRFASSRMQHHILLADELNSWHSVLAQRGGPQLASWVVMYVRSPESERSDAVQCMTQVHCVEKR
jgi:SAM-dependent MidA family methyltransferase